MTLHFLERLRLKSQILWHSINLSIDHKYSIQSIQTRYNLRCRKDAQQLMFLSVFWTEVVFWAGKKLSRFHNISWWIPISDGSIIPFWIQFDSIYCIIIISKQLPYIHPNKKTFKVEVRKLFKEHPVVTNIDINSIVVTNLIMDNKDIDFSIFELVSKPMEKTSSIYDCIAIRLIKTKSLSFM